MRTRSQKKTQVPTNQKENDSLIYSAKELFRLGQAQRAYDILEPLFVTQYPNTDLYILASAILEKLERLRDARWMIATGALLFPMDEQIRIMMDHLHQVVNGKIISINFTQTLRPVQIPSISLVLIVKNEEENLSHCLSAYQDIVQEIVVLDTGSTDRTVEIARSFGARVEFFPWVDDFAAARNESLKYATCDWILRTDADEYIEDSEKPKLIYAILSGAADVYLGITRSKMANGQEDVVKNVRLIKNHLGIHFENPIHETVVPSIIKLGLTMADTNISFVHTGYHLDQQGFRNKYRRNLDICRKGLLKDPGNTFLKFVIATILYELNSDKALGELEDSIRNLPDTTPSTKYLGLVYIYLSKLYVELGNLEGISDLIRNMLTDFIMDRRMVQLAGELSLYILGRPKEAYRLFRFASGINDNEMFCEVLPPEKFNLVRIRELILESNLIQSDCPKAQIRPEMVHDPKDHQQIRLKTPELELATKFYQEGKLPEAIEILTKGPVLTVDGYRLLIKCFMGSNQWDKAIRTILSWAVEHEIQPQDYLDLAVCQVHLLRFPYARHLVEMGRERFSNAFPTFDIEQLISNEKRKIDEDLDQSVRNFILDPSDVIKQQDLEKAAMANGLTPFRALKTVGKKWIDKGQYREGLFSLIAYSRFQPDDHEVQDLLAKALNSQK